MRCFKLLLMGGIVLALAVPASALSFTQPYSGPITMHLTNYDIGTQYWNLTPGYAYNNTELHALPTSDPGGGGAWRQLATGGLLGATQSDTWGILRVDQILKPDNTILWSADSASTEITALFYGLQDQYNLQTQLGSAGFEQDIRGTGMQIVFFEDSAKDFTNSGPTGWVWDAVNSVPTYATVTDGTLLWTMASTAGFNPTDTTNEFFATFQNAAGINTTGDFLANMTPDPYWGTGTENWTLDTNSRGGFAPGPVYDPKLADVLFHFGADQEDTGGFLLHSYDPIKTSIIPEPVTMAGMLLGIGCLGRYVRRRR